MRHFLAWLVAGVIVGTGFSYALAHADTPGCVSRGEYDNMTRFLSVGQVAGRFDTNGVLLGTGAERFKRGYDACWTNERRVVVWFSLTTGLSDDWGVQDY